VFVCVSWFSFSFKCTGVFGVPLAPFLHSCLPPYPFPFPLPLPARARRTPVEDPFNARVLVAGAPHHTLDRCPHAARYSGGVSLIQFMYVYIDRQTPPQRYLFPFKGHAARVTWASKGLRASSSSPNYSNRAFICLSWWHDFLFI